LAKQTKGVARMMWSILRSVWSYVNNLTIRLLSALSQDTHRV